MHLRYYKPDSNAGGVSVCVCVCLGGGGAGTAMVYIPQKENSSKHKPKMADPSQYYNHHNSSTNS